NFVSIDKLLPIGADNLDKVDGNIKLMQAKGNEKYVEIGTLEEKNPKENEVIYMDDKEVLCRRWNWRECEKSKLTEDTENVIVYAESMLGKELAEQTVQELADYMKEVVGGEIKTFVLDEKHNVLDIEKGTLHEEGFGVVAEEKTAEEKEIETKRIEVEQKQKKHDQKKMPGEGQKKSALHWADAIAEEVIERVEKNPQLKKIVEKNGYFVYDEKTPSGRIHIGSGRGWIIHDIIAKALRDKGVNARFVLSNDDIDPFDKMNKDLPKEYEKYLGMPFMNMPSPDPKYKTFAEKYFMECIDKFEEFGIVCDTESTGQEYIKGTFNDTIKIALDNAEQIKDIYKDLYGSETIGASRFPFNPICEKCGKIGTTNVTKWLPEEGMVEYECLPDFVDWARGCGHKGKRSPFNGGGKFPWKVEWAAKWPSKGVIIELAGKDHFTKGGSRTCACRISVDIFKYPPPYPSSGYRTGKGYEFFQIGGKKMSTSKGRGVAFADITEYAPAQMLRFLLVKSRPHAVVDFDPFGANDLILLYDRYDKTEQIYYGVDTEGMNEKDIAMQKRIYELSRVGKISEKMPIQVAFTHCAIVIQIGLAEENAIDLLKKSGHIPKKATEEELEYVKERLRFAKKWVDKYAPEQYKFQLQEEVPVGIVLDAKQKKALKQISVSLKAKEYKEIQELHDEFYNIARYVEIEPAELFKAAYLVLIKKERGPQLANFVLTIGQEKVAELFEKV
ncbi:lysine--tRNA ligase, partial [Candidatus Woesearchaeota archaeon]|nr:lysine--tRNA ligase [Candidatus Woesearchaeota archaeon]